MRLLQIVLLMLVISIPFSGYAETEEDKATTNVELVQQKFTDVLKENQNVLDNIKQQVSKASTDSQFNKLLEQSMQLSERSSELVTALQSLKGSLKSQLDVLGPPPKKGALPETSAVAQQRMTLNIDKQRLDDLFVRAQSVATNTQELIQQIIELRRVTFKSRLALNYGSILSLGFWSSLMTPDEQDWQRLSEFSEKLGHVWDSSWSEEWRYGTAGIILLAVIIWALGRYYAEPLLVWFSIRYLPDGRLRRSFVALGSMLLDICAATLSVHWIYRAFTRVTPLPPELEDFVDHFFLLAVFCILVASLGRTFLSNRRPSWRLVALDNTIAKGLRHFPLALSGLSFIFGTIELVFMAVGASLKTTIFNSGIATLALALILLSMGLYIHYLRKHYDQEEEHLEKRSVFEGVIEIFALITSMVVLFSLLIGYITFAHFIIEQAIWFSLVFMTLNLFLKFSSDAWSAFFSPNMAVGRSLKRSLALKDRHLELLATIFIAICRCVLLLLMIVALLNGSFGKTTPDLLLEKIVAILSGEGLKGLNIVPGNLLNAALCLVIGSYILRAIQRWLSNELLPKTFNDIGIRASLTTLFSNISYVVLILITLSTLGIQWSKLAWIVSALSVGIGFGLQEIVKNFISGLILLTERPVKVGDMISIGGIEGDVRRINVRATEIQLSDRSTVIVPNSQLISQNVRNATMGNAQGVVTIELTFPISIDPEQVRDLLIRVYQEHETILDTPAPYVRFSKLSPEGIVLSVTGYVLSPRVVGSTKSALLFNLLKVLNQEKISLSSPRELLLMEHMDKGEKAL